MGMAGRDPRRFLRESLPSTSILIAERALTATCSAMRMKTEAHRHAFHQPGAAKPLLNRLSSPAPGH
jgi:hypothetical protein